MSNTEFFISVFITFIVFGIAMAYYVSYKCEECRDECEPCSDYDEKETDV